MSGRVLGRGDLHLHAANGVRRCPFGTVGMIVAMLGAFVLHSLRSIPYGGIFQVMDEKLKKSQLARLSRIEGQVRGVARMIEEDRYCIDVITQVRAVRAALDKVEQETLSDHLRHCVAHAFHAGTTRERQTKIDELLEVLDNRRR